MVHSYNKSQVLVLIYKEITERGLFYMSDIMKKYGISNRTYRRYLSDLEGLGLKLQRERFGSEVVEVDGEGLPVYDQKVVLITT